MEIIWQIILISLAMVLFSQLFSMKFAINPQSQMELQMRIQDMQERLKLAQQNANAQEIQMINQEMMMIMQTTMKQQLIPTCIRSIIFIVIFGVLSAVYSQYNDELPVSWYVIYLFTSLIGSLVFSQLRKFIQSKNPNYKKPEMVTDKLRALQNTMMINSQPGVQSGFGNMPTGFGNLNQTSQEISNNNPQTTTTGKTWKQNLIKSNDEDSDESTE